jgi:hypothetical protein
MYQVEGLDPEDAKRTREVTFLTECVIVALCQVVGSSVVLLRALVLMVDLKRC